MLNATNPIRDCIWSRGVRQEEGGMPHHPNHSDREFRCCLWFGVRFLILDFEKFGVY
jgi:hypothetical protein